MIIYSMTLIFAAASVAADAPAQPVPAQQSAKPQKVKRICKPDRVTGSRLSSRTCKTQAEWDAIEGNVASQQLESRSNGVGS
ncbi:hypothetical protein K5P26_07825 [Sphingopyxis sp. XHP0097]|jgi:hypothetical protein|uniref:Uncharacterized protein n=1 Tax=Sphingopyxis jiangsuensis TaxID=2871171 RepID=A0ABS7MDF0_9SPHN|nr:MULTISPECIES: hypothetical protein [Sphingopyxis]MBY4637043.1 hypothetical protein [Sphingopyxis jiangsuensis]